MLQDKAFLWHSPCLIDGRYEITIMFNSKKERTKMDLFTIGFAICLLSGMGCFWLFYQCIDWFEKI